MCKFVCYYHLKIVKDRIDGYYSGYDLADGSSVMFAVKSPDCSQNMGSGLLEKSCGSIIFDIKKKNIKYGVDRFYFTLTKDGIIPGGVIHIICFTGAASAPVQPGLPYLPGG